MVQLAKHLEKIMDPPVVEIENLIDNKVRIISFGQGVPFFYPTSTMIKKFWIENKNNPSLHMYSPDLGFVSVRKTVSKFLSNYYGVEIHWKNVILTNGGNSAFFNILSGIINPKDEVIIIAPYYFNHIMAVQLLHGIPVCIDTNWEKNFIPEINAINERITDKTKAIIIITPNNPTGTVYDKNVINDILNICEERDILLILDETYSEFIYDGNRIKNSYFHKKSENLVHIGSYSKSFGLSGWRIGYAVLPSFLLPAYLKVQDTTMISPPTISQLFIGYLLKNEINLVVNHAQDLIKSRNSVLKRIKELNLFEIIPSFGAFYFFVKLNLTLNGTEFAHELASKCNVIVIPGEVFGESYIQFVRFSYGSITKALIDEGFNLIETIFL